nr:immunoglobulin heavy chain junction region [Mus musculus]
CARTLYYYGSSYVDFW